MEILYQLTKDQPTEIRNLRADIMECFDRVGCFLMPHPGKKVTRDKDFNGNLSGKFILEVSDAKFHYQWYYMC